jgi:16S rRNA (uracil1498-N3)-methyltransferase
VLVEPGAIEMGVVLRLDPEESRHLASVLRSRPGEPVVVADGCGVTGGAVVRSVARRRVELEVDTVNREAGPARPGLVLCLAVLHGSAMDWAVQKSVEVDVGGLLPVCTEQTQVALTRARRRVEHWRRVARQALKQCHRVWAMEVRDPVTLAELMVERGSCAGAVADADGVAPRDVPPERRGALLVGPEGGFTAAEIEALEQGGWVRVSLGRHVLRAETAAVVGAALLQQAGPSSGDRL